MLLSVFRATSQEFEAILWEPGLKLAWHDFKARPASRSNAAAITASGISYEFSTEENNGEFELEFTVHTYFYPGRSWYQPEVCDAVILSHEQLHFDISELFARKFRKVLQETRFSRNVKAEVGALFRQVNRELAEFQDEYDKETNFSRNREQQQIWNMNIARALEN
jgi:hypothetical protein